MIGFILMVAGILMAILLMGRKIGSLFTGRSKYSKTSSPDQKPETVPEPVREAADRQRARAAIQNATRERIPRCNDYGVLDISETEELL